MVRKIGLTLLCLLTVIVSPTRAQQPTTTKYTSDDGSFTFSYPAQWYAEPSKESGTPMWGDRITLYNYDKDRREQAPDALIAEILLPQRSLQFSTTQLGSTPAEATRMQSGGSLQLATPAVVTPVPGSTPEPLKAQPVENVVTEFTVNGRPAARVYTDHRLFFFPASIKGSMLYIVVDVGNDYLVAIGVAAPNGGQETIKAYESAILAVVETMRFTPPQTVASGNPDLPQVYSGPIGIWQRGTGKFFYPATWQVIKRGTVILLNQGPIPLGTLKSGQVFVTFLGRDETRASSGDSLSLFNNCDTSDTPLTGRKIIEKQFAQLTPEKLKQAQEQGITVYQPEVITLKDRELVLLRTTQKDLESLTIIVDLGGGNFISMIAQANHSDMPKFELTLLAIAGTVEHTPTPCVSLGIPTPPSK